jgi:hypothetical protein
MMAMEAPRLAGGLPPPPAAPPPPSAAPLAQAGANMKTMMATEAPQLTPQQRTMMAQAAPASPGIEGGGTQILPDSAGVVAYAAERAHQARVSGQSAVVRKAPPAGPLFWLAWVVLGLGAGLGIHFILMRG